MTTGTFSGCICRYAPDGTPEKLCEYHRKWAEAIGKGSRDATLKQVYDFLETRGISLRMQDRTDDGLLLLATVKEMQEQRRPITIKVLKAYREGLRR